MYINPTDKAKVDAIIAAFCKNYQIDIDSLKTGKERSIVEMRQQCYYVVSKNTKLSQKALGFTFNKARTAIVRGIQQIEFDVKTHPSVKYILKEIIFTANVDTSYAYQFTID
jgi:chromosomal replication initiation ATPase DnaA